MDKAHTCLGSIIGFTINGERDDTVADHNGGRLIEVEKPQCCSGEVADKQFLYCYGGNIQMARVFGSSIGESRVVVVKGRVENVRINVI